jgi:phenylalanyl-tRNA synthetase alpha subunit
MTPHKGHLHPVSLAIRDIRSIFAELGFDIALGPELETEFYNFDALNIPANHPARDMQDTFWIANPSTRLEIEKCCERILRQFKFATWNRINRHFGLLCQVKYFAMKRPMPLTKLNFFRSKACNRQTHFTRGAQRHARIFL